MNKRNISRVVYPAILVVLFGICYLRTLFPTIWFGDTAEFQTIAYLGGLAHTTGYPLYLTLAKPFVFSPVGNPALNLNFMSALFGVLTVLAVYWLIAFLVENRFYAWLGAIVFGCGITFWSQTSMAEVYTLHNFIFALIIILVLKWEKSSERKYLQIGLFLLALSLGNHLSILLLVPPIIFLSAIKRNTDSRCNSLGNIAALVWPPAIALFIAILLYFIHDATASPYDHMRAIEMMSPESWGKTAADFDSFWERMFHLLTARQFSGSMFNIGWSEIWEHMVKSLSFAVENLGIPGIIFGLAGFIVLFFSRWKQAVFFAVLSLSILIYNLDYDIWKFDIDVYFIPLWMITVVMTAICIMYLSEKAGAVISFAFARQVTAIIIALIILTPMLYGSEQVSAIAAGHPPGEPDPYKAYNSTKSVMQKIEDNAIIFALWHQFHVIGYILLVEESRTGIAIHELFPAGETYDFSPSYLEYIDANIDIRPIYLTYPANDLKLLYRFEYQPPLIRLRRY